MHRIRRVICSLLFGVSVHAQAFADDDPIAACAATQASDSAITGCLQDRADGLARSVSRSIDEKIEAARRSAEFNDVDNRAQWIENLVELKAAYAAYVLRACKPEGMFTVGGPASRQDYLSCMIRRHLSELTQLAGEPLPGATDVGPENKTPGYDGHTCATVAQTGDGFVAVRTRPSPTSPMIGRLKAGDFIDVASCPRCSGPWRRISHVDWNNDAEGSHPLEGWASSLFFRAANCGDEP